MRPEFDTVFAEVRAERVQGLVFLSSPVVSRYAARWTALASAAGLPTISMFPVRPCRRTPGVRPRSQRTTSARGHLRRQDPKGAGPGRAPDRSPEHLQADGQYHDSSRAQYHCPRPSTANRRRGDRVAAPGSQQPAARAAARDLTRACDPRACRRRYFQELDGGVEHRAPSPVGFLLAPGLDQSQNTRFPDYTTDRFLPADHSFEAFMNRISSAEFVRSFSHHADAALTDPVVITHHGRDRLVMLSVDTYRDLLALAVAGDIGRARLFVRVSRIWSVAVARQCATLLDARLLPPGGFSFRTGVVTSPGMRKPHAHFPAPWKAIDLEGGWQVVDANGQQPQAPPRGKPLVPSWPLPSHDAESA